MARGFAEAMNGTLNAEDTPGGGLTMVLTLRAAHTRVEFPEEPFAEAEPQSAEPESTAAEPERQAT
ncbi:hypothetical protein [Streptomyces shaanxiensis]